MTKTEIQQVKQRFGIIGNTEALLRAIDVAIQVAPTDLSVLITGESGVGKESFPQIIHQYSRRKHGQYIAVNCGAIPEGTIDSELFGHEKGAFTGELSPEMLVDAGVSHVIIGHSERRMYFNESNTVLNLKMHKVLEHGIIPILCCGETLEQREKGITLDFVKEQIVEAYVGVTKEQVLHTIVAYEPIWAIGTGKVATTAQAQEVCGFIRTVFEELYDKETADQIRILYGGSVNASNAAELFAQPDIDGGLVGGASLKPDFADIVNYNK